MAQDIIKPVGATKSSKNDAGGGVIRSEPVVGVVKNNIDPIRAGRIQVYIQDMSGMDPDDSKNWVTVRFLSPFYGRSYPTSSNTGYGGYASNPVSYGEWHSPPEIGTQVICIFVNGDMNYGYYIGCIPEPEALTMVPAIGAVNNKVVLNAGESQALGGATQLPVTNLNTNNSALSESSDFLNSPKPVHSYVASVLSQQGLIRDPIRGPITSSAQRETPSRVGWGVSTPGRPIYEGGYTDETIVDAAKAGNGKGTKIVSRRAGHTFVMDDGDLLGKDQLIRLRTSLGHQILMSDDGQCLFIIHANGQSWIELGKEGTIDMFATNSVNIRTQGDLNLHADNDVNINAEKSLNINAKENININSDKETTVRTGTDFKHHVLNNFTTKVDAGMSMGAAGEGSYASGGTMYVNGSVINLNTGQTGLTPPEVKPIPLIAQTDTLFDNEKGFAPAPAKLQTIVTRAPAHQPWAMANKGVDVKTTNNASDSLPSEPSSEVQDANDTAPSTPENPASVATVATVPALGSAGGSLDTTSTAALVSATAVQAGATASQAVNAGTSITNGIAQIGQLAQTPSQLVTGGTIKPGADRLINGLVANGASVNGAMTNNLFTGQGGVSSVQAFVGSTTAQVSTQISNLSKAQASLTNAGVLTGKENPGAIAGVVLSGAQNGVAETVNFIKTAASVTGQATAMASQLGAKADAVAKSISSGNFASNLSSNTSGGLGGITSALGSAFDKAKGAVTSAFNSIVGAYKSFKPNIPQDLKAIASKGNSGAASANTPTAEAQDPYAGLTSEQVNSLGDADATDPYIRSRLGLPSLEGSPVSNPIATDLSGEKNFLTAQTGLQGLPGGTGALASVVNKGTGSATNIPGASTLNSAIANISTASLNNIPTSLSQTASRVTSLAKGLPSGALPGDASSLLKSGGSLLAGASALLPKDLSAQLNSAISSLSASGPVQIKIPTIAENTVDRSGFNTQVNSILGNAKIPAPKYETNPEVQSQKEAEVGDLIAQQQQLQDDYNNQFKVAYAAKQKYESLLASLPAGDPAIAQAKAAYDIENKKYYELYKQADRYGLKV